LAADATSAKIVGLLEGRETAAEVVTLRRA
jgi:hypothetical protein